MLDPGDMQPGLGQSAGRVLAAGTHADHDHICMLWLAHAVLLPYVGTKLTSSTRRIVAVF